MPEFKDVLRGLATDYKENWRLAVKEFKADEKAARKKYPHFSKAFNALVKRKK